MAEISQLPTETIATITGFLDGFDICRLWLCGEGKLMFRLANGGVVRFELMMDQTVNRKWPKIVSQFRQLEFLRIAPSHEFGSFWFTGVDFGAISPTLRHLELGVQHLALDLLGMPFALSDLHPDPIWSPPTKDNLKMSPFPMDTHFQNLETLIFPEPMLGSNHWVPLLPKTLRRLHILLESISSETLHSLPPHLTQLELPELQHIVDPDAASFPNGLTYLDLQSLELFGTMPPFPETLTYLNVASCRSNIFHLLPPHLVTLVMDSPPDVSEKDIAGLPSSLLHLQVRYEGHLKNPEILPPQLQTFHISEMSLLDTEKIRLLPRTLTNIIIGPSDLPTGYLLHFPPCLRSLRMYDDFFVTSSPYPFLRTLERLEAKRVELGALEGATNLRILHVDKLVHFFELHDVWRSLVSLTDVTVYNDPVPVNQAVLEALPPTLKILRIHTTSEFPSLYLPRNLLQLTLNGPNLLRDDFLANLPPNLRFLEMRPSLDPSSPAISLSDLGASYLPRKLDRLFLYPTGGITDDAIPHLPPHLTRLGLESSFSHDERPDVPLKLTDACVPHLPRRLISLRLSRCPGITGASVKHMPRSLENLFIGSSQPFDPKFAIDMPPLLRNPKSISPFGSRVFSEAESVLLGLDEMGL